MNNNPVPWFNTFFKDKINLSLQAFGGLLDSTMMTGDRKDGIIKFPKMDGRSTMYKLTGAIQPVPVTSRGLTTIDVTPEDFQATEFWFTQDAEKSGPSEQGALVRLLAGAVRRKRDTMKLDQLTAFHTAAAGTITTIGGAAVVPDILHFEQARAEIAAYGDPDADGDVFAIIPEKWASQFKFYKEFANKDWTAPEDAPWGKAQRAKMRTLQGVTYIVAPDEYFVSPGGTDWYGWMWHKDALGCEISRSVENADLHPRKDLEGRPMQADVFLSGAAIGLRPELVKRMHFIKNTTLTRPA